jgi:DNA-binding winged helix-turn-helix (wHTH) protein
MGRQVRFGAFTLDAEARQLLRGADRQPVHLSPKAYELLVALVDDRPRAIAKRELHARLWPSTFVSEATLASLVGELRTCLSDRGRHAHFVRTVHGFGYAFAADAYETGDLGFRSVKSWIVCNGRERPLADGEHVIGRDPHEAIPLGSPSVSRHHAKIVVANDVATLEDLGSKNGTYLRGRAVTATTTLADGDLIRIGAFELTFRTISSDGSTETAA